ncbi:MAG: dihydrodipicolinate synthase family protein [Thermoguttaceae bacterium]|nr:dihydrodipicolinate synthase family protein [Thermoguttaceae bacterium]
MADCKYSRRSFLGTLTAGALGVAASDSFTQHADSQVFAEEGATNAQREVIGDPRVRGPFPILSTPFLESGEVDYETLADQAKFVDWCESPGMIWPQAGDAVDLLTMDEKMQGMEVLAATMKERKTALCLGVQGKDIDEMLVYAKKAEELEPTAIISRPPDDGKTEEDLADYWRALMKVVNRPVIIQTSGGTKYKGPAPSLELLIQLGKESPYFGYVKEESAPIEARMQKLVAAKPDIKRVFSAMGGHAWLYQLRLGTEGLITERAPFADVLAAVWRNYQAGDVLAAADAYSKLVLMLNMRESIGGNSLRGFTLYIWQKRGVFKNRLSREYGPNSSIPEKPIISDFKLNDFQIAELDMRFEAMKPYLKECGWK